MILCIDIGNTHIFCGIFIGDKLHLKFRHSTYASCSSDQLGLFLRTAIKENDLDPDSIINIAFCSVVPTLNYSLVSACIKYFGITPFELKSGVKTGLHLKVKNPLEIGSDRIANSIAAVENFANKNIIVIDFGTATTMSVISDNKEYLGGAIFSGYKMSMESLCKNTAKLTEVDILKPNDAIGKSTEANIQSGLYYSQLGTVKELIYRFIKTSFIGAKPVVIATGGYAYFFEEENIFTANVPDLILHGLRISLYKNHKDLNK